MLTKTARICSVLVLSVITFAASSSQAQDGLSTRSLQKLSRAGDPTASIQNFGTVCKTVREVTGREFLWKSEISNHINPGDPRATGPTFICNQLCPLFPMSFYYSDGSLAGAVGYYGKWNVSGKSRAYCAAGGTPQCFINQINTTSRRGGRDGYVYLQTSRKTGATVCYKVRPLGRTGNAL